MSDPRRLLSAALEDGSGPEFARRAAAHARQIRRVRRIGLAGATATALGAVLLIDRPGPVAPASPPPAPAVHASYEKMSDAELMERLRDQPVLVLKDGRGVSGVVFLEAGSRAGL
ncbi:MAG TPA: hypothetical protein VEB66_16890 [Opitutaceae bacterium]|nr:hypothetical protein [Opitutaceae bacterium]